MHEIVLNGYTAHNSNNRCLHFGTAESYGIEQINVTAGPGWEDMLIKAVFRPPSGDSVVVLLGEDGIIDVPPAATAVAAGEYNPGLIVFSGVSDGVQRISADIAYTVLGHAPVDGKDSEPTPSQWEQLAAQYQSKVDKQQGTENAGKFLAVGENGEVALSEGVKPEQIAAAVDAYLDENPIETGATPEEAAQIRQNKTDIETLQKDKLSTSELDSAIDSALAQAKASGEFDGKDGDPFTYEDFTEEQLAALKGKDGDDYTLTEADKTEIAEQAAQLVKVPDVEIPSALPNPHALTFAGAVEGTYDGSAPLTVEIPQGGSGEEKWEIVTETELTEGVTNVIINTDMNGNAFELKKAMAYCYIFNSGTTDNQEINVGFDYTTFKGQYLRTQQNARTIFLYTDCSLPRRIDMIIPNTFSATLDWYNGVNQDMFLTDQRLGKTTGFGYGLATKSVKSLRLTSGAFATGCKFKIYGVRV